jgi:hypothetical protein
MSEQIEQLKDAEKKKLDAAFETYGGAEKDALPVPQSSPVPSRAGNPNLGVLLIAVGIFLFLTFSGFLPNFGFWGWFGMCWLFYMVFMKRGRRSC